MLSIYNKVSEFILILNSWGNIVFCNDSFLNKVEYDNSDILNLNISKISNYKHSIDRVIEKNDFDDILEFTSKSKESLTVKVNISCKDYNNEKHIYIVGKEINTKQYTMEMLEDLLDNINISTFILDENGKFLYGNKSFTNIVNSNKDDLIGSYNKDHWTSDISNILNENNREVIINKKPKIFTEKIQNGNDTTWYESYKAPLFDQSGKFKYLVAETKNITLSKALSEELCKNFNNTIADYTYGNDNLNKILTNIGEHILNYTQSDGISISIYDENKGGLVPTVKLKNAEEYLKGVEVSNISLEHLKCGKYDNYINRMIPINEIEPNFKDNLKDTNRLNYGGNYLIEINDEFIGVIGVSYSDNNYPKFNCDEYMKYICNKIAMIIKNNNLTKEVMVENNNRKSIEKEKKILEEAVQLEVVKNEFFSNISHEFRTPINIILGTTQVVNKNIDNHKVDIENLKRHISYIKQNSYRLLKLVNNLIDLSRMDIGMYELKCSNQNIVNIIEDITMSVTDYTKTRNLDLIFDTNEEEVITYCDPDKIERIVLNLLSNAIKYTKEEGTIWVNINATISEVTVSVKDSGIGIPKEKLDVIFNRFSQVDDILNRRCEGSGIGLSLVKNLVLMHGGEISVMSEVNIGTEFVFTIPIKVGENSDKNMVYDIDRKYKHVERCNIEFSDIYSK